MCDHDHQQTRLSLRLSGRIAFAMLLCFVSQASHPQTSAKTTNLNSDTSSFAVALELQPEDLRDEAQTKGPDVSFGVRFYNHSHRNVEIDPATAFLNIRPLIALSGHAEAPCEVVHEWSMSGSRPLAWIVKPGKSIYLQTGFAMYDCPTLLGVSKFDFRIEFKVDMGNKNLTLRSNMVSVSLPTQKQQVNFAAVDTARKASSTAIFKSGSEAALRLTVKASVEPSKSVADAQLKLELDNIGKQTLSKCTSEVLAGSANIFAKSADGSEAKCQVGVVTSNGAWTYDLKPGESAKERLNLSGYTCDLKSAPIAFAIEWIVGESNGKKVVMRSDYIYPEIVNELP